MSNDHKTDTFQATADLKDDDGDPAKEWPQSGQGIDRVRVPERGGRVVDDVRQGAVEVEREQRPTRVGNDQGYVCPSQCGHGE